MHHHRRALITRHCQIAASRTRSSLEAASIAEESLATLRTAKAFGIEDNLVDLYDESNREATRFGIKRSLFQGIGMGVFFLCHLQWLRSRLLLWCQTSRRRPHQIGNCHECYPLHSHRCFLHGHDGAQHASSFYAFAAGAKVFETIDRVPPIDSSDPSGLRPTSASVNSHSATLISPIPHDLTSQWLDRFNLEVPAGKVTALVGASGSGKSTIVSLVERFYDPDGGAAFLDDVDLRDLNLKWLRTQIGLVSRNLLFSPLTSAQHCTWSHQHSLSNRLGGREGEVDRRCSKDG